MILQEYDNDWKHFFVSSTAIEEWSIAAKATLYLLNQSPFALCQSVVYTAPTVGTVGRVAMEIGLLPLSA